MTSNFIWSINDGLIVSLPLLNCGLTNQRQTNWLEVILYDQWTLRIAGVLEEQSDARLAHCQENGDVLCGALFNNLRMRMN